MDIYYLELMNKTWIKVFYALCIAYASCFDPVYAIGLTTFVIISLQELHNRYAKMALVNNTNLSGEMATSTTSKSLNLLSANTSIVSPYKNNILLNDTKTYDNINKHTLQKTPHENDKLISEYDFNEDPAFSTLTQNVMKQKYLDNNKFYITGDGMNIIQNNKNNNVDQNISVEGIKTGLMNIQGLPIGFDKGLSGSNPLLANV
jgi:hypothetical protein